MKRRFAFAQAFAQDFGKAINQFRRDFLFRVCELTLKQCYVGLDLCQLRLLLCVLLGETLIGRCEMTFGHEIEQPLKSRLERSLPGAELPKYLAPGVFRFACMVESFRKEGLKPLGLE